VGIATSTDQVQIDITAYADDSRAPAGNTTNLLARGATAVDWSKYSGVVLSTPKSLHSRLTFDEEGVLLPNTEGNISLEDPESGAQVPVPLLQHEDRIRELGFFTATGLSTDQSFLQAKEECDAECDVLVRKGLKTYQLQQCINSCTIQRLSHRMRFSTTNMVSLNKIGERYGHMVNNSARLHSKYPLGLKFGSSAMGGLGQTSFSTAIYADRMVALFRIAYRGGEESDILAGAVKRSEMLHQSTTPVFNRNTVGTWDNTWVGRISDFLSSTNMSISGGQINNGFRQDDVSIATLFEGTRDLKLVQEGCIHFKIHWVSQILSEDSSTWKAEVQDYRQLFNGKFTYMSYSTDGIGARTAKSHTSLARTWLDKVKKAICTANVKMGDFNMNCKSNLREFDVVLFAGDPSPRIVIFVSPALDKITTLSTTTGMRPAHFKHSDGSRRRWVVSKSCPSGPGIRSSLSAEIFSVDADCTARNDDCKKAIKVEVQLLPRGHRRSA